MKKITKIIFLILVLSSNSLLTNIKAQSLTSPSYELIEPTVDSISGIADSPTYSILTNSSPTGAYSTNSSNYNLTGGTAKFVEANVPTIDCIEASTDGGSTVCTGVPGSDGMQGVCSQPGCYDRAKIEIGSENNPVDASYAIQISTVSDFSSGIQYIDGATRLPKSNLTISDFLFKCDWEGTVVSGYCNSANTTYQKFNILGLTPGTTYYVRLTAHHGDSSDANFTQSAWGPSQSVTIEMPTISMDIDIATTTAGSSNAPYVVALGNLSTSSVTTASDYIIFRFTTNALSGGEINIKGVNNGLQYATYTIPSVNNDLASIAQGFGLRNDSTTNSAVSTTYLGNISVSASPSDFTDTGAPHRVGSPSNSLVQLFDSGGLPLNTGVSAYWVKAKASTSAPAGNYSETLNTYGSATF